MTDRVFAETNLIIYTESNDQEKSERAIDSLEDAPVISSTQAINEADNANTIHNAIDLVNRYSLSHWDSLIVAAAFLADCQTLYSEDFQHGQKFDNHLKVQNPFNLNQAR